MLCDCVFDQSLLPSSSTLHVPDKRTVLSVDKGACDGPSPIGPERTITNGLDHPVNHLESIDKHLRRYDNQVILIYVRCFAATPAAATVHEWRLLELFLESREMVLQIGDFGSQGRDLVFKLNQPR